MAYRYVYLVNHSTHQFEKEDVEFIWKPGFSKTQKQKSIMNLHEAFKQKHSDYNLLEVSSKSTSDIGVQASAFNLEIKSKKGRTFTVEQLFQTSKVYKKAGSQSHLLNENLSTKEIKQQLREIDNKDMLTQFECFNKIFPLEPKTFFYNWLYINALNNNKTLASQILKYDAFTDIEFNPSKSFNCQAEACSIYVSLIKRNLLDKALISPERFLDIVYK